MRHFTIIALGACSLIWGGTKSGTAVRDEEPKKQKPPELKVLEKFIGSWDEEVTETVPKERRSTGVMTSRWILDGWFLLFHGRRQPGDQEYYTLSTYDAAAKVYRYWYFNERGQWATYTGQWDEESRTMKTKSASGTGTFRLVDDNATAWKIQAKDASGKVTFDLEGKAKRRKKLPERAKPRVLEANADLPALKALDGFVGSWTANMRMKPAKWTPKETRSTSSTTNAWVLNGWFQQHRGKSDDSETLEMYSFDRAKKVYRFWLFESTGNFSEWTGQWDEKAKTITFKGDWGKKVVPIIQCRFLEKDYRENTITARDEEGVLLLDVHVKLKRQK